MPPPLTSSKLAPAARVSFQALCSSNTFGEGNGRLRGMPTHCLIHTTSNRPHTSVPVGQTGLEPQLREHKAMAEPSIEQQTTISAPLSLLPLTTVLRSYATTTISSSPTLLPVSLALMKLLANSNSAILNPDRNPILRYFLKKTFYTQFCAGENKTEVNATINGLKSIGFTGVILAYAKEVVLQENETQSLSAQKDKRADIINAEEISSWTQGTLETVKLAKPDDYVALKFTGSGRQTLYNLSKRLPPSPQLAQAIDNICELSVTRGVRLLFDAEQHAVQPGIDDLTLAYMKKYNTPERAVVYGTYQTYLKATPQVLSEHLQVAQKNNFALGVKLVRGAYIGSDPRHLIHDTKADTDAAFDGVAQALLKREWTSPLATQNPREPFPVVDLVLASHNADSVRRAQAVMKSGAKTTEVAFAQLQGMADEVSCEILMDKAKNKDLDKIQAYKYLVWGSAGECMKYLLRRAHENRDAVQRTKSGRDAMGKELSRRFRSLFSM